MKTVLEGQTILNRKNIKKKEHRGTDLYLVSLRAQSQAAEEDQPRVDTGFARF
jgi:hypothetical protein